MSVETRGGRQMHTIDEVKSTCNKIDVSPSKSSKSSPIYGGGGKAQAKGEKGYVSKNYGGKSKKRGSKMASSDY